MSRTLPNPPPGFDGLSAEEKLDYVQSLWDHIVADPEKVPVLDWHQRTLEERLVAHHADPDAARPWEEVRERIAHKLEDFRSRKE